ncbi:MAG TPA: putative toxin-antitoxin system toxin component, PIN family [Allocoleopsis sp.]
MTSDNLPLVVLDTSVFISAFLSKNRKSAPGQIIKYWKQGKFKLVMSPQILEELVFKLLEKKIAESDIKDILKTIFIQLFKLKEFIRLQD